MVDAEVITIPIRKYEEQSWPPLKAHAPPAADRSMRMPRMVSVHRHRATSAGRHMYNAQGRS